MDNKTCKGCLLIKECPINIRGKEEHESCVFYMIPFEEYLKNKK